MNKKIGNINFVNTAVGTYAIRMDSFSDSISHLFSSAVADWDSSPTTVAGVRVVPWGADNNLPSEIRNLLEKNNLGPGILARKTGLLYGQGPMLYRVAVENNERVQQWTVEPDIQDWLDSWDYKRFIREAFTEYNHLNGVFVKYTNARSVRVGRPWVHSLEVLPSKDCRLCWPENDSHYLREVTHILCGDFDWYGSQKYIKYPVFDKYSPTRNEVAAKYHSLRSFGRNMYAVSSFFGSIPWMRDANSLPEIIEYLNKNMIAAAYVVHVPQEYWEKKREYYFADHPEATERQANVAMETLKDELSQQIADVMAGKGNVGKFFMATDYVDTASGRSYEFKIEPIEMNIDKYIEALYKISRIADSSTTSGFGLNPSLANIIIDGKGDSGSQMLYALKLFYGADTQIAEDICLEAINDAIHINFPDKKYVNIGIYRKVINKEDNVTASDRTTNQV